MPAAHNDIRSQLPGIDRHPSHGIGPVEQQGHAVVVADLGYLPGWRKVAIISIGIGEHSQAHIPLLLISPLYGLLIGICRQGILRRLAGCSILYLQARPLCCQDGGVMGITVHHHGVSLLA